LTGRLPFEHGIRDNFSKPLDANTPTLTSILKQRGCATGGFIGTHPVSRDSGLQRGFDVFDDPFAAAAGPWSATPSHCSTIFPPPASSFEPGSRPQRSPES